MKSKLLLLCLLAAMLGAPGLGFTSSPNSEETVNPESPIISDLGYQDWQAKRKQLDDSTTGLAGSKPVKSIREEIKKTMKDTHSLIKAIYDLEPITKTDRDPYQQQAEILAGRFEVLAQSLSQAAISPDVSPKESLEWQETRKDVLAQLSGVQAMLRETAASLQKMSTGE